MAGRFLQGVGAGGLVPATLALVADLWPAERRGVPLGVVSAVQELGSVIGPLYGAVILAVSDWRVIFAVNMVVGWSSPLLVRSLGSGGIDRPADPARRRGCGHRRLGRVVCLVVLPGARRTRLRGARALVSDVTWGQLFMPDVGRADGRPRRSGRGGWPRSCSSSGADRAPTTGRPAGLVGGGPQADLPGALFLAAALGGVILAFATADPRVQVLRTAGLVVPPRGGRGHRRVRAGTSAP